MEETIDREFVNFTDDDGNEGVLEILNYFFYNGDEYAILTVVEDEDEDHDHDNCDCEEEQDVFFMKVVPIEDDEIELVPVDDELSEKLIEVVNSQMDEEEE